MAAGNKGIRGGAQPGAGRKKRVDEEWARKTCIAAIEKLYGSVEEGIEHVLSSNDDKIKLFIWEHVLGIPETKTKVKLSDNKGGKLDSGLLGTKLVVEVVRTIHNKDVDVNADKNNDRT